MYCTSLPNGSLRSVGVVVVQVDGSASCAVASRLGRVVERIKPSLHLCGHVHAGRGSLETEHTLYVNGALLSDMGDINPQPLVMRMAKK